MPNRGKDAEKAKVPLQAVVLADSFAQRFRPITLERPKVLLPLVNVPMIEYTLEFLASNGVEEVFVFCCAHAAQITAYLEQSAWSTIPGFVVHAIVSTNCVSAGEAMRLIDHRHVIRADFVLVSGDTVANMDLRRAIEAHRERRKTEKLAIMTMCVKASNRRQREERAGESNLVIALDPTVGRVLHYDDNPSPGKDTGEGHRGRKLPPVSLDASLFSEHPNVEVRTDLRDCHVDVCAPEVLYLFTDNFDYQQIRRDFVCGTLNERELGNNVYAHELGPREYAARVHNLRTYDAVSRDIVGRWTYPHVPDVNSLPRGANTTYSHAWPHSYAESDVRVDPSAVIGPGVVLGAGCVVGKDARVSRSVLGRGVVVGAGCVVDGSYLQERVRLGERVKTTSALICEGSVVHDGAVVGKGAVLSYDVVLGPGAVAADYSRVSLASQPRDDDDDSDDDSFHVGSAEPSSSARRMSGGAGAGGFGFGSLGAQSGGAGAGAGVGSDYDSEDEAGRAIREGGAGVVLSDAEKAALDRAKAGTLSAADSLWPSDGVGAGGAGYLWHCASRYGAEDEWRFSVAPAPAGVAARAYDVDDGLDSDDDRAHVRDDAAAGVAYGDGDVGDDSSDGGVDEGEAIFRKEVAETFLRCVKHGYAQANAVVELQGLKMAENRTFADIARYVLMTILGLSLPAPRDVAKENAKLYPARAPEGAAATVKAVRERVKEWAPLLTRFLKSEDDQVEMLLTLEDYCAEDEVFRGMNGGLLVPAFAKILHMLYDVDVLSEVSVLAWAEEKAHASEEDRRFLKLAQPFVDWLKDADEESDDDSEEEESDSD